MSETNSKLNDASFLNKVSSLLRGLLIFGIIVIGFAFFSLFKLAADVKDIEESRVASYKLASELRQSSNDLTRMARSYVVTGNKEYLKQYNNVLDIRNGKVARPKNYDRIYWNLIDPNNPKKPKIDTTEKMAFKKILQKSGFTDKELEQLNISEKRSNALAEFEKDAFSWVNQVIQEEGKANYLNSQSLLKDKAKRQLFGGAYSSQKVEVMKPIDVVFALMEERVIGELDNANKLFKAAKLAFLGLVIIVILSLFGLIFFNKKLSTIELEQRTTAQKLAEEENEQLNNSVIDILQSVSRLSQKDLTARAPVTEDIIGTVSDSINYLTDETSRVLKDVTMVAGQVKDSSSKVQTQAHLVSETAKEERESVRLMIESLFEATQTMKRVAALAEKSNQAGKQATEVTENALETVNGTVTGMESIRETISETEKRIKRLGERSQEISGIVNLINTISERTHVLALNASMQAAVAGEAGRGFAVVAEEVQRLAESSRNATQQIASLVNNIQIETNETINTVNNTITQVVEGSKQAQRAGEQMRETQQITAQLVEQVQSIAEASDQQKTMSVELLESVKRIGESTEKTASQIESQNDETENLQVASQRLVDSVGVFKLPE